MSYCRFGEDSDVSVFHRIGGALSCCGCLLTGGECDTRSAMIAHLREHIAAGDAVPDWVIPNLEEEIAAIGDAVTEEVGSNA